MSGPQRDTDCAHAWRWLPQPVYIIGGPTGLSGVANVECESCGARTWAHGRMPAPRPDNARATPTTVRS